MQEKILVGHKLRRLRQSMELSQTAMSEILDISPSYLNLLEHNQRPLTVALLLRLGNSFDIDLKEFAEDDSAALSTSITEIFTDPLLAEERVPRRPTRLRARRRLAVAEHANPTGPSNARERVVSHP